MKDRLVLAAQLVVLLVLPGAGWTEFGFRPGRPLGTTGNFVSGQDSSPRSAGDGRGTWCVVWHKERLAFQPKPWVSRTTDDGLTWSEPLILAVHPEQAPPFDSPREIRPQIATDCEGTWVIAWIVGSTPYAARSMDNGVTWGIGEPIGESGSLSFPSVSLTYAGDGIFVAVGPSDDSIIGTDAELQLMRSTDGGGTWEPHWFVNPLHATDGGFGDYDAAIDSDGDGSVAIVWNRHEVIRSIDHGATFEPPVALRGPDGQTVFSSSYAFAADGSGNWILVMSSADDLGGTLGTDRDILFSRSADNAATWSALQPVNSNAATDTGSDSSPSILCDGLEGWLAVWHGILDGGDGEREILGAFSSDAGASWSDPVALDPRASGPSGFNTAPHVAGSLDGVSFLVWVSSGVLSPNSDIFFSPSGCLDCHGPGMAVW